MPVTDAAKPAKPARKSLALPPLPEQATQIWQAGDPLSRSIAQRLSGVLKGSLGVTPALTHANQALEKDQRVVLVFLPLEQAILAALEKAESTNKTPAGQAAVTAWCKQVRVLLRLWRSNRKQVVLIDACNATLHPEGVNRAFDLPPRAFGPAQALPPRDLVAQVVVAKLMLDTPEALTLMAELAASTANPPLPVDPGAPPAPVADTLYQDVKEATSRATRKTALLGEQLVALRVQLAKATDSHRAEKQALITARDALQQQLDTQSREQAAEIAALQQTTKAQAADQTALAQAKADLEETNASLNSRLHQIREGLASAEEQIRDLRLREQRQAAFVATQDVRITNLTKQAEQRLKALQDERARSAELQAEHTRILGSFSLRITAPLRWVKRLLKGGSNG